jgi:hypothetical protein
VQVIAQVNGQSATRFQRGRSGNPTGRQRWQDRLDALVAAFLTTHGREPAEIDLVSLRAAARLASAAENPRTNAEQAVRASNTLHKTLRRLGLASPPAKAPAKSAVASLDEECARIGGGE